MKNTKRDTIKIPDLRNGVLGSLWFSKADRNLAGGPLLPAAIPSLMT